MKPVWEFTFTEGFRSRYPSARMGFLAVEEIDNTLPCSILAEKRERLQSDLAAGFGAQRRDSLRRVPPMDAYCGYYRRYKKTYHVLLQLESVAKGQKGIPEINPIVETMFMAELRSFVLTAVHDGALLEPPVVADTASGSDSYVLMTGASQTTKEGDMVVRDASGITSSIIYGPDGRTAVTETTRCALFVVYAPEGVEPEMIHGHFEDIEDSIRLFSPDARIAHKAVLP